MQKKRAGNCRMGSENHLLVRIWNCRWLYVMLLPVLLYYIIFKYVPMYGITMALRITTYLKVYLKARGVVLMYFRKFLIIKISGWWYGIH